MNTPGRRKAALIRLLFNYSSTAFVIINGIILVPVYLSYFDIATYGSWLASGNIIGLLAILDVGLTMVVGQRLAQSYGAGKIDQFQKITGAGLVSFLVIFSLIAILSLMLAHLVPPYVKASPSQFGPLTLGIQLAGVGAAFNIAQIAICAVADAWQRTLFVGFASFCSLIAGVIAILLGLHLNFGVAALGLGTLARGVVGFFLTVIYVIHMWSKLKLPKPIFDASEAKELLHTSGFVFVGRTSATILSTSDALFITVFINPTLAAIYVLTSRVFNVAQLLINPIQSAVAAGIAHLAGSHPKEYQHSVAKEVFGLIGIATALVLGPTLALNKTFVSLWVGPPRFGGLALNLGVCLATFAHTQALSMGMLMNSFGYLKHSGWIGLTDACVRLLFILILLPTIGILGMPLASLIASSINFVFWLTLLRGYFQLNWNEIGHFLLSGWGAVLTILPLGFAISVLIPLSQTWTFFIVQSIVIGLITFVIAFICSAILRQKTKKIFNSLLVRK